MHRSAIELHRSAIELHRSAIELHRSAIELHRSAIELHRSAIELHRVTMHELGDRKVQTVAHDLVFLFALESEKPALPYLVG